jgi:hypothetical protein
MPPPDRFLPRGDWSIEDLARWQRDSTYRPENPAYVEARRKALSDAGFELERPPAETDPAEMTAEDHLRQLRGDRQ